MTPKNRIKPYVVSVLHLADKLGKDFTDQNRLAYLRILEFKIQARISAAESITSTYAQPPTPERD